MYGQHQTTLPLTYCRSHFISVSTVARLWAGRMCSIPGGGWEFFPSPTHPDRYWNPHILLSSGYERGVPRG